MAKFVKLTDECWVNPEQVTRVEKHGNTVVLCFPSGRERAFANMDPEWVVRLLEGTE